MWLSNRSYLVNENHFLVRPTNCNNALGVGPDGLLKSTPIVTNCENSGRKMYEMFTSLGYAIVDSKANIVTTAGIVSVAGLKERMLGEDDVIVESFVSGSSLTVSPDKNFIRAPHMELIPTMIEGDLHKKVQRLNIGNECVIPRSLFAYATAALLPINVPNVIYEFSVDNKVFPCEMIIRPTMDCRRRLLAVTEFIENVPICVLMERNDLFLAADGLLVS